jgi:glucose-1-phosphate adenylyltransferase
VSRSKDVVTLILGGGRGTRLRPLTSYRAKPAVPIGGKYRLIDIPVSNSLNSGLNFIYLLTQFQSHSLHRHIVSTYSFDRFSGRFIEILAAEQTEESADWFQGTADAVWKHRIRWDLPTYRDVVILSGDQLYRMDYGYLVRAHREGNADVTIAAHPVRREETAGYGLLRIEGANEIREFVEKPSDPRVVDALRIPEERLRSVGVQEPERAWLASMGIYVFRREALRDALQEGQHLDFGKHLVPSLVGKRRALAYPFNGYWEDIGTIRAFFEANIRLAGDPPSFTFNHPSFPIYTHARSLQGALLRDAQVRDSIISEGCRIGRATVADSVIGVRSVVEDGARLSRVVMMGADYHEDPESRRVAAESNVPTIGIGRGAVIENAIVDKAARIGEGVVIRNEAGVGEGEGEGYVIQDGIVVVPKNAVVPPGTVI